MLIRAAVMVVTIFMLGVLAACGGQPVGRVADLMSRLDSEGYVGRAVEVLNSMGYDARRNEVGHIAIASA